VAGREAHHARELDTFAALTVPTMRPLACYAASDLGYPLKAQSAATEKGAKRAMHAELLRLAPPVAAALLWRRRLAHKQHRNPQTNWRFASMGSSWDWPSNRRKEERGGGWQTRLNAASIVVEQSGNERRVLRPHPLPRRAFGGQISAISGHCRHSPDVGNTLGTY